MKTVFILGISSDIGRELGRRYLAAGWKVVGTYRTSSPDLPSAQCIRWDVAYQPSIAELLTHSRVSEALQDLQWDVFIAAIGTENPIGPFFSTRFSEWKIGVQENALGVLHCLRFLWPLRANDDVSVVFFSGSGTNHAAVNYSAYSASKILLMKMCEILAAENPRLNISIIGPGIVRTKIHQQTIEAGSKAGDNLARVEKFLASHDPGTDHDDIFDCVTWCTEHKEVSGRNISLVYDWWRDGEKLLKELQADPNMYTLRRYRNEDKKARILHGIERCPNCGRDLVEVTTTSDQTEYLFCAVCKIVVQEKTL